jgi:hypothetical protein
MVVVSQSHLPFNGLISENLTPSAIGSALYTQKQLNVDAKFSREGSFDTFGPVYSESSVSIRVAQLS